MATNKAYTDIKQSKVLAEFLPIESADMYYDRYGIPSFIDKYVTYESIKSNKYHDIIPCWSLAALLKLMPTMNMIKGNSITINYNNHFSQDYDNPIDAAFEMVCWLKEDNEL